MGTSQVKEYSHTIEKARELPGGARFFRCALQVNPFEYLQRHSKSTSYPDEAAYNKAAVQACLDNEIEVIAIMDHYQVRTGESLRQSAVAAGIHVFPGFEAVTKDGVHLLCLFPADKGVDFLERVIGACGIHEHSAPSPIGKYDVIEFLEESVEWEAICIAAHVAGQGGLLTKLSGQSRINAWQLPHLLACSLPGAVTEAPDGLRPILENKNPNYHRDRVIAVLNAQDVDAPEDFQQAGASCWIKMSEVSVEGLRQAFLDPESRIRLPTDPEPEEHAEFVAMAWEGGFLDQTAINFNQNLNVLIGGRGTGKSTVVESLRSVLELDPLGDDARKAHEGIIRHVLRSGTKVSLLVRSHRPSKRDYLIERTIPNPSIVRDETGNVLPLTPLDVLPNVQVFGQHEISDLTKSRQKLTRLLDRFVDQDEGLTKRKTDIRRQLERSRGTINDVRKELTLVEERLDSLPALEETLKRFQQAGLEERLKEQSLLVREERILNTVPERVGTFRGILEELRREIPIDLMFLSAKALQELPGKSILAEAETVLRRLSNDLEAVAVQLETAIERADQGFAGVRTQWAKRKTDVQASYEKILRELQKAKVDGEEFIRLRRQIEDLRPLKERKVALARDFKELQENRRNLLAEWEDVKAKEFRQLEAAAKKVSRRLAERVRVRVTFTGNREPLCNLLRDEVGGRLSETIETFDQRDHLSLSELAAAWREGHEALSRKFGLPPAQAKRLGEAPDTVIMQMEELDLESTTKIELNVAPEAEPAVWQSLEELSAGQKATAVLLLLLLESDAPLVVDQPEDDLDNRFITEGVVPKMREEKRRRQFVFTTHNANIPVLGDAELILGLTAMGEADEGRARIPREHMGSIDARPVREMVEEVLEGGKEAFEMRRLKYGF